MATKRKQTDPFADDYHQSVKQTLQEGERGTFVETALANPQQTALTPYTRIAELSEDMELVPLEDVQGEELVVWKFNKQTGTIDGKPSEYLTLEVSRFRDAQIDELQGRFLVNCGGIDVMRKIENAFDKVNAGKATPPLVGTFYKKRLASGNSFWILS